MTAGASERAREREREREKESESESKREKREREKNFVKRKYFLTYLHSIAFGITQHVVHFRESGLLEKVHTLVPLAVNVHVRLRGSEERRETLCGWLAGIHSMLVGGVAVIRGRLNNEDVRANPSPLPM